MHTHTAVLISLLLSLISLRVPYPVSGTGLSLNPVHSSRRALKHSQFFCPGPLISPGGDIQRISGSAVSRPEVNQEAALHVLEVDVAGRLCAVARDLPGPERGGHHVGIRDWWQCGFVARSQPQ